MKFDYVKAWTELALPSFEKLPQTVKDLLLYVENNSRGCAQHVSTALEFPANPYTASHIRDHMEALIPSGMLQLSARIIYFYGHWFPGGFEADTQTKIPFNGKTIHNKPKPFAPKYGSHWHYAQYADQILRKHLKVPRDSSHNGYSIKLIEGALRFCYASDNMWVWEELCAATPENKKRLDKYIERKRNHLSTIRSMRKKDELGYESMRWAKKLFNPPSDDDPWYAWFNIKPKFYS